ncbi:enoyl-CoA hydratase/isomerase family protein [Cordyceps javanica]|uniref:Enoyl-CoA hydratase/isomerase family protein n=1 Tax=Cordyceps javanica TaxID=43265 RepID=A0A545UXI9_9HYPO|nr:enoyl-CoA hydratase/isomerase family protein [Cordyceps javanica]TQW06055.1 enoyl-CoA hydratase/isomerase family protein [Cordyceps javanica]
MTDTAPVDLVLSSTPAAGVRLLCLNRPEKRNALSQPLIRSLLSALSNASADDHIFSIILTGNGPFFCAGADLNDIATLDEAGARASRYLEDLCKGFAAVKKPIIAAVNGPALGGGFEIALMSDFIVSAEPAYFVLPETKIGLIPGAGGTQRLTAAVGKYRAMRSILLAERMTAEEAMAASLVASVVNPDNLTQRCLEMASNFTAANRQTIEFAKQAICRADDLGRDDGFERDLYYTAFGTDEKKRGVDDFLTARRKKA